ncbi:GntR family transcriptional regulator [Microvirga lotononidis]|uniref:Transcriptional regulator n=1 Tax=Microvirga lotononidis TaxID=864069 RepID=I4YL44_9HYPH|nr:GntR family transcriptional regulator [Microvirga lotononidis]EIM24686.1 transcriptional regulator [Microvirga lotononidis]WQO26697.1 GntR family transcriptional regulator [Microvirga lotononidis]
MTNRLALAKLDISREPMARQVTRALRQAIVSMRIAPGEMLSEQDLAQRFGVSRSPVREALIKLSEAGLVRVLPQRGTQVVKISRAAVEDARFIRVAVECAVVREAALKAPPVVLAELNASLTRQRRAQRATSSDDFMALDEEFHRLLAEAAGRPAAWRMIEDVKPQMDRVRYLDVKQATPRHLIVAQHADIVEAIKASDPVAAEQAMHQHLSEILRSLPELAAKHPDLFEPEPDALPEVLSA